MDNSFKKVNESELEKVTGGQKSILKKSDSHIAFACPKCSKTFMLDMELSSYTCPFCNYKGKLNG